MWILLVAHNNNGVICVKKWAKLRSPLLPFFGYSLISAERQIWSIFRKKEKGRLFPPFLFPSWFSLSVGHSYLWEIRLETVTEKRWGAKSGRNAAPHVLSLYSPSSSPPFSISSSSCPEVLEHSRTPNHLEFSSLFLAFLFHLSLATSLCFSCFSFPTRSLASLPLPLSPSLPLRA